MTTPKQEGPPAIEVSGLSKRFGTVVALDGVSFAVNRGELFFLLGPSGCGKTTLLRILAGLETQDAGTVSFDGREISTLPSHERGCPMVFQSYALWPHLSVRDNIAFGLIERRVPRDQVESRVQDALRRMELAGLGARMPGQLSGGQQQRVVLARALVLNPNVVLLDEPLSNLDAKLRGEMREEIERLHRETDITFVYVTHDQTEALSLADRMIVMNAGRISALGVPRDLYHRPPSFFCADFLGEANVIPAEVTAADGGGIAVKTAFGAWRGAAPDAAPRHAGERVRCVVRPESIRQASAAPGANRLRAKVQSLRMNGSTVTTFIEAAGVMLKVTLLNRYSAALPPGTEVEWEIDPADSLIFGDAAGGEG